MSIQQLVTDFHRRFGFPISGPLTAKLEGKKVLDETAFWVRDADPFEDTIITQVKDDVRVQRASLMIEELSEAIEAMRDADRVKLADALADLTYVVYGTAVAFGIDLDPCVREVHRSNMTKTPGEFKPVKGIGYSAPDLAGIL